MKSEDKLAGIVYAILSALILLAFLSHFDWQSNWVSFLGSLLGGLVALLVMYFTNKAGKENVEKTLKQNKEQHIADQRLNVRPYIVVESKENVRRTDVARLDEFLVYEFSDDGNVNKTIKADLVFRNVGKFAAIEFDIKNVISLPKMKRYLKNGTQSTICNIKPSIMSDEALILTLEISFFAKNANDLNDKVDIDFIYNDILGNTYSQKTRIMIFENYGLIEKTDPPILYKSV